MCLLFLYDLIHRYTIQEEEGGGGGLANALQFAFVCVFFASTIAHTFHMMSSKVHRVLFRLDWSTIGLAVNTLSVCLALALDPRRRNEMGCLLPILILIIFGFHNTDVFAESQKHRKIAMIAVPTFALYCFVDPSLIVSDDTEANPLLEERRIRILHELLWPVIIAAIGLICFVLRIPERFSPGTFDRFGHSHNIHHIWSSIDAVLLVRALRRVADGNA